ncbi:MAG: hypothetical protein ACMUIM_08400 [bacterium]
MDMNVKDIIKQIKIENENERQRIKDRIVKAFEEIEILKKDFLKIDNAMEKMIIFGSLAEDRIETIEFDIDIAVKSDKYYQLVGRALESEFKVDVVDLDTIHKRIKKDIIENGRVIYEKNKN